MYDTFFPRIDIFFREKRSTSVPDFRRYYAIRRNGPGMQDPSVPGFRRYHAIRRCGPGMQDPFVPRSDSLFQFLFHV